MKCLFLVSSMHAGGAERVAATLVNAWSRRGDSMTLAVTYTQKGACFYTVSPDVELVWLADHFRSRGPRVLAGISKLRAMRRLIRQKEPDLIISFLTNVNVMALLAARGTGVPVIACERTSPAASTNVGATLRLLRKLTYPWARFVTVQTAASVAPFRKMVPGVRCPQVLPNPLPPELLDAELAERVPDGQGRQSLVAMGRLVPQKQFDYLIQSFSEVAADYPLWDLVIWGEGPLRSALELQAQNAGLSARVFLPGRTEHAWAQLARAHVFALTSAVEGFPNVLLEAMALGLPCIAFDCPSGPRELTRDGRDALLLPAGDRAALTRGLRQLLGDPVLRDRLAGSAAPSVRQRYALPVILSAWDALIARARTPAGRGDRT